MRQQHLKKWRWLYALWLFLWIAVPLQAYDMGAGDISSSFDKSTGSFSIRIPIYDDDGKDEGLHNNGHSVIRIKVGNGAYRDIVNLYSFPGAGDPQGDASWYWVRAKRNGAADDYIDQVTITGSGSHANNAERNVAYGSWTEVHSDKSGSKTHATLRFYLNEKALAEKCYFDVRLRVDKNEAGDYDITSTREKTETFKFNAPDVSNITVPSGTAGFVQVKASAASPGGGSLWYECSLGSKADGSNNAFNIKLTSNEQEGKMKAVYSFNRFNKGAYTITKERFFTVPKYNHVDAFTATQDKNGATLLTWKIAGSETGTMLDGGTGGFVIEKKVAGDERPEEIKLSSEDRSWLDKETIHNPGKEVTYRIWRELPTKWSEYLPQKATINKKQVHSKVASFSTARLIGSPSGGTEMVLGLQSRRKRCGARGQG